jgi:hypothetical protein
LVYLSNATEEGQLMNHKPYGWVIAYLGCSSAPLAHFLTALDDAVTDAAWIDCPKLDCKRVRVTIAHRNLHKPPF